MRRSWIPLLLGLLVLIVPTATAAPVSFSYSVSTPTLRYGGAGATASIVMRTRAAAQTVSLRIEPGNWQDRHMFGSPLRVSAQHVTGPGRITGTFASSCCDFAAGASICQRGGPPNTGDGIILTLPADSTTMVSYRVHLAAPPWPAPVYLGMVVGVPASAQNSAQITQYHLGPAQFAIRGRTGVQIQFAGAIAGARRTRSAPYPVVSVGHTVKIAGTTSPKLIGARLQIGYRATTSNRRGVIGTVTTDRRGGFSIAWEPPAKGTYTITSSYRRPTTSLLADHNCDLGLSVS
ncbi:MAG: hypothetical protein M3070_17665 [Actinomycetota bacterium]|nr:hypothetical protein [Actinomycetota bacterium]